MIAASVCGTAGLCSRLRELVDVTVFASEILEARERKLVDVPMRPLRSCGSSYVRLGVCGCVRCGVAGSGPSLPLHNISHCAIGAPLLARIY
jgi:hypothetical protein